MSLIVFFVLSVGVLFLIRNRYLPRVQKRLDKQLAASPVPLGTTVRLAGTAGALKAAQNIAGSAALAALLVTAAVMASNVFGRVTRRHLEIVLVTIGGMAGTLSSISGGVAWSALLLLVIALLYAGRRAARTSMRKVIDEQLAGIRAQYESGEWVDLPPSTDMAVVLTEIIDLQRRLSVMRAHSPNPAAEAELESDISKAEHRYVIMDWERRIDVEPEPETRPTSRIGKVAALFFSKGTFSVLSDFGRIAARVAGVLAFLLLIGVESGPLRAALDERWVDASALAVQRSRDAALQSLASGPQKEASDDDRESSEPPVAASPATAAYLARQFEIALGQAAPFGGTSPAPDPGIAAGFREDFVRTRILQETLKGRKGVAIEHGRVHSARAADGPEPAVDLNATIARAGSAEPLSPAAADVAKELQQKPNLLRRLTREIEQRQFSVVPSVHDLAADVVMQGATRLMSTVPKPDGAAADSGKRAIEAAVKKGLERWVAMKKDVYVAELVRSNDVSKAKRAVIEESLRLRPITVNHAQLVKNALGSMPEHLPWVGAAAVQRPAVVEIATAPKHEALILAAMSSMASPSLVRQFPRSFRTYDDVYPPHPREPQSSSQTAVVDKMALIPRNRREALRVGKEIETLRTARAEVSRSFPKAAADVDTGGIVFGIAPDRTEISFRDLLWSRHGNEVELSLLDEQSRKVPAGRFPADLVQLSLAFVADGRPTAVTVLNCVLGSIANGLDVSQQRVLLHPVFIDTAFGNELVQADKIAYDIIGADNKVRAAYAEAGKVNRAGLALYDYAWLARARYAIHDDGDFKELTKTITGRHRSDLETDLKSFRAASSMTADPQRSILAAKRGVLEGEVIDAVEKCGKENADVASFGPCLLQGWSSSSLKSHWNVLPASGHERSGVREKPFSITRDGAWLRTDGEQFGPIRFLIQLAFDKGPVFLSEMARLTWIDSHPFEYPLLQDDLDNAVTSALDQDRRDLLKRIQQFTLLQRVFRAALDGKLGSSFPAERLIDLAKAVQGSALEERTQQWIGGEQTPEAFLAQVLNAALAADTVPPSAAATMRSCQARLRASSEPQNIPAAEWAKACNFAPFRDQAAAACKKKDRASCYVLGAAELSGARELRLAMTR